MASLSTERIWGPRGHTATAHDSTLTRHFIFPLKENVFEAVCRELKLVAVFHDESAALHQAMGWNGAD